MVRLIHTADLHLDTTFSSRFSKEEAEERRQGLLLAWNKLLEYGAEKRVQAVLIAGDLFDSPVVSRSTMDIFLSSIRKNPEISFFYLRGNHDTKNTFRFQENLPKNLFLFSHEGKKYRLNEKLVLAGQEFYGRGEQEEENYFFDSEEEEEQALEEGMNRIPAEEEPAQGIWNFKEEDCNLLMLHGMLRESSVSKETSEEKAASERTSEAVQTEDGISLRALSKYPIHYLALGHIHKREEGRFGALRYLYPGCLQGRGFDEEGEKGFYYLEINEQNKEIRTEFVPLKDGEFRIIEVLLSEEDGSLEALEKITERIREEKAGEKDSLRIILKGEKSPEGERNLRYLEKQLSENHAYVEIKEECRLKLHKEDFIHEKSLKGEFLRMVSDSESLSEEEKEKIILLGIGLLQGEEL